MNKREMKKELMNFLIREWLNDKFAHVKFLHFINEKPKEVSEATIRRLAEVSEDLAFKYSDMITDFEYTPVRK